MVCVSDEGECLGRTWLSTSCQEDREILNVVASVFALNAD